MRLNKNNIIILISLIVFFIVIIIFFVVDKISSIDLNNIKKDKSKEIVYTIYSSDKYEQSIPYINIDGDIVDSINENIIVNTSEYIDKDTCAIYYDYSISNDILSLIVMIFNYDIKFISYNINLKDKSYIEVDDLLDSYNITINEVDKRLNSSLLNNYNKLSDNNKKLCDFNCFKKRRGMDLIDSSLYSFYVENGNLYVYIPISSDSSFGEGLYLDKLDYRFNIVSVGEKNDT